MEERDQTVACRLGAMNFDVKLTNYTYRSFLQRIIQTRVAAKIANWGSGTGSGITVTQPSVELLNEQKSYEVSRQKSE